VGRVARLPQVLRHRHLLDGQHVRDGVRERGVDASVDDVAPGPGTASSGNRLSEAGQGGWQGRGSNNRDDLPVYMMVERVGEQTGWT
jgi:hypothetical protein